MEENEIENNFDETDLIFDNNELTLKDSTKIAQISQPESPIQTQKTIEKVTMSYAANLRKLVITSRNQIGKLQEENTELRGKLESDSVVRCPSCLFLHKTKANRFLPKYIKAYPGRFTLELEFKSKEELLAYMEASQLQADENGIAVVQPTVAEKRDCLFDAGSNISKLVESAKKKFREDKTRISETPAENKQLEQKKSPIPLRRSPRKQEKTKIPLIAEKPKESLPEKQREESKSSRKREKDPHEVSKEPVRKRKPSEESSKPRESSRRERCPKERRTNSDKELYGSQRKDSYPPLRDRHSSRDERKEGSRSSKYEFKRHCSRESRSRDDRKHDSRRRSREKHEIPKTLTSKAQSPFVSSTSKSTPRQNEEEFNISDFELVEEIDDQNEVESAEDGELPASPIKRPPSRSQGQRLSSPFAKISQEKSKKVCEMARKGEEITKTPEIGQLEQKISPIPLENQKAQLEVENRPSSAHREQQKSLLLPFVAKERSYPTKIPLEVEKSKEFVVEDPKRLPSIALEALPIFDWTLPSISSSHEGKIAPTCCLQQEEQNMYERKSKNEKELIKYALRLDKNSPRITEENPRKKSPQSGRNSPLAETSISGVRRSFEIDVIDEGKCENLDEVAPGGSNEDLEMKDLEAQQLEESEEEDGSEELLHSTRLEPEIAEKGVEGAQKLESSGEDDFAEFGEVVSDDNDVLADGFESESDDDFYF